MWLRQLVKMIRNMIYVILPIVPIRCTKKDKYRLKVTFPKYGICRGWKTRTRKFNESQTHELRLWGEKNRLMIKVNNYFLTPKVRSEFLGHVISELTTPLVCEKKKLRKKIKCPCCVKKNRWLADHSFRFSRVELKIEIYTETANSCLETAEIYIAC